MTLIIVAVSQSESGNGSILRFKIYVYSIHSVFGHFWDINAPTNACVKDNGSWASMKFPIQVPVLLHNTNVLDKAQLFFS